MYPKKLMPEVCWNFRGTKYDSIEEFVKKVSEYHEKLDKKWNPDEIVLKSKEITIQYAYWDEDENDEVEEGFTIVADGPNGFKAGELLFAIHNDVVEKLKKEDKHFFDGLMLWEGKNLMSPEAPLYFLIPGN